jgi:hypothetical protein
MQSHDEIIVEWKGDILVIYPQSPFDEEGVEEVIDIIKKTVRTKNNKNWSRLEVWSDNSLGSPAVMSNEKAFSHWCNENGCVATALVVENGFQRGITKNHLSDNVEVFSCEVEATNWLMAHNDS